MKYKFFAVVMGLSVAAFMFLQPVFSAEKRYGPVKAGDNLWAIAAGMRPDDSVSVQQMMLAIRDKNPQAFYSGNINSLETGYILFPPSLEEVRKRSRVEALQQVQLENREWKRVGRFNPRGLPLMMSASAGNTHVEALQAAIGKARQEQAKLSAEIDSLREQLQQEQGRSKDLLEQLKQLQQYRNNESADSATGTANAEQEKQLQAEIADLKQALAEKDARIEQLEAAAKQVAAAPAQAAPEEVARLKSELEDTKQLLEQRDIHIQNLQASLREASITIKRQFAESKELHARLKEQQPDVEAAEPQAPSEPGSAARPSLTLEGAGEQEQQKPETGTLATATVFTDQLKPAEPVVARQADSGEADPIPLKNILQQQQPGTGGETGNGLGELPQPSRISIIVALVSMLFIFALAWRSLSQQRSMRKEEARLRASLADSDMRKEPGIGTGNV